MVQIIDRVVGEPPEIQTRSMHRDDKKKNKYRFQTKFNAKRRMT